MWGGRREGPRAPRRSHRVSASSMECVVSTTALPRLAAAIVLHSWRREAGSRPVEGSSKYVTAGSPINEMAHDSRLFMPACIYARTHDCHACLYSNKYQQDSHLFMSALQRPSSRTTYFSSTAGVSRQKESLLNQSCHQLARLLGSVYCTSVVEQLPPHLAHHIHPVHISFTSSQLEHLATD